VGRTFTVHINVAGHSINDVKLAWGLVDSGEGRRSAPSFGTHIEVPAVVELLDLVVSGKVTAAEARDILHRIATKINDRMDEELDRQLETMERAERMALHSFPRQSPRELDSRSTYAVSSEADPKAIKIGVATDTDRRLKSLQVGSASPILLRWSSAGGFALERHLHDTFGDRRISGEWFDFRDVDDPAALINEAAQEFLQQFDDSQP
jgi:uncharacterized protein (UPF0212 family)